MVLFARSMILVYSITILLATFHFHGNITTDNEIISDKTKQTIFLIAAHSDCTLCDIKTNSFDKIENSYETILVEEDEFYISENLSVRFSLNYNYYSLRAPPIEIT